MATKMKDSPLLDNAKTFMGIVDKNTEIMKDIEQCIHADKMNISLDNLEAVAAAMVKNIDKALEERRTAFCNLNIPKIYGLASRVGAENIMTEKSIINTIRAYTKQLLCSYSGKKSVSGYYANIVIDVTASGIFLHGMEIGRTRKIDGDIQKNVFVITNGPDGFEFSVNAVSDKNFNEANLERFAISMQPILEILTQDGRALSFERMRIKHNKTLAKYQHNCYERAEEHYEAAKSIEKLYNGSD